MKTSILGSWAFVAMVFSSACASDPSAAPAPACGAGTVASNGTCVAQCGPGTTLEGGQCVPSGGTGGGTGTGGATSAGGAGATGPGGATSGSGGAAATGGATMAGPGGTGVGTGGAGQGGGAGGSGGASTGGAAGGLNPGDEPCPAKLDFNCSTSCGPMNDCSMAYCAAQTNLDNWSKDPHPLSINSLSDFPVTIRLPSHPPKDPACATSCSLPPTAWSAVRVWVDGAITKGPPPVAGRFVRVRVDAPWLVVLGGSNCGSDSGLHACATGSVDQFGGSFGFIAVGDPTAANATFEVDSKFLPCP